MEAEAKNFIEINARNGVWPRRRQKTSASTGETLSGLFFAPDPGGDMKFSILFFGFLSLSACAVKVGRVVTDVSITESNTLLVQKCNLRRVDILNSHSTTDCETQEFPIKAAK